MLEHSGIIQNKHDSTMKSRALLFLEEMPKCHGNATAAWRSWYHTKKHSIFIGQIKCGDNYGIWLIINSSWGLKAVSETTN